jgi:hypothetical protein
MLIQFDGNPLLLGDVLEDFQDGFTALVDHPGMLNLENSPAKYAGYGGGGMISWLLR